MFIVFHSFDNQRVTQKLPSKLHIDGSWFTNYSLDPTHWFLIQQKKTSSTGFLGENTGVDRPTCCFHLPWLAMVFWPCKNGLSVVWPVWSGSNISWSCYWCCFRSPTFLYNKNPHLIKSLVSTMLILWPQILTYIDPFSTLSGAGKMSQLCIKNQPLFWLITVPHAHPITLHLPSNTPSQHWLIHITHWLVISAWATSPESVS